MPTGSTTRDPEQGSPSFFKVIQHPSSPHLLLPNAFVRRYLDKIPKHPTLVTASGEFSWQLEFVRVGEDYCFAHGWEMVVRDVGLCSRDIVVFWLVDHSRFLVTFLGANGCEKYPLSNDDDGQDDDDVVGQCDDDEGMTKENLCFRKVLSQKTFKYFMTLPAKFVKAAGLENAKSIKVKDHEGKEWTMGILAERYKGAKYSLTRGWVMFRRYHRLSHGDICIFTFSKDEGVLNLTQVLKSNKPIQQEPTRNVKIEDDCSPAKRPSKGGASGGGGGVKVKVEDESVPEMEVVKGQTERQGLKSCVSVKIEDGSDQVMVGNGMGRMPPPEKPSGNANGSDPARDGVFRSKHVIYF